MLRVNVGKTKVMKCGVGLQKVVDSVRYPLCGVCSKGVKTNSIQCTLCMKCVHKSCSGIRPVATCRQEEAIASSCFDKYIYSICLISTIISHFTTIVNIYLVTMVLMKR